MISKTKCIITWTVINGSCAGDGEKKKYIKSAKLKITLAVMTASCGGMKKKFKTTKTSI